MLELRQAILNSYRDSTFFEFLISEPFKDIYPSEEVVKALLHLHNDGEIDVISAYKRMQLVPSDRGSYKLIDILSQLLPDIECSVIYLMDCFAHLSSLGHATHALISALFRFCERSEDISSLIMKNLKGESQVSLDFQSVALISGAKFDFKKYAKIAMNIVTHKPFSEKYVSIQSLGRMPFQSDKTCTDEIFKFLSDIPISIEDSALRAAILQTLHSIYLTDKSKEDSLVQFIKVCSLFIDSFLIQSASRILFIDGEKSSQQVEDALFDLAVQVSHSNREGIDNLDYALKKLIDREDSDRAIKNLERILLSDSDISIGQFDALSRSLLEHRDTYLSKNVTKWLLSGETYKGRICFDLLKNQGKYGLELSYDIAQLSGINSAHHLFLTEKACGWFFSMPLTAISLISSLADSAPSDQIKKIKDIVFHTIVVSYPDTAGEYLKSRKKDSSKKAKTFLRSLLKQLEEHNHRLSLSSPIKELRPSLDDRIKSARHSQTLNANAMKIAEEGSLLSFLVPHKVVLLYGRKSIYFVHNGEKKFRAEAPMATFSTSFERSSLEILNPHNIEFALLEYRLKGVSD